MNQKPQKIKCAWSNGAVKQFIKDLLNVPNTISLVRLMVTPFLPVLWFTYDSPLATLFLGLFVGLTDLLDGILARKLNQMTDLGALIDQLSDLIFESTCLIIALMAGYMWMGWLIVYLFREFTITVIRSYVHSKGGTLPSSWIGKAKSSLLQYGFFLFFLGGILSHTASIPIQWNIAGITPGWILTQGGMLSILTGIAVGVLAGWKYLRAFVQFYIGHVQNNQHQDAV